MRRHRRNQSYLRWIAGRVASEAALALALLGLGQATAQAAGAPVFDPFAVNPLSAITALDQARPALGDLDGDGDLDLLVGNIGGTFQYFKNTGNATSPLYLAVTGAQNPANGLSVASAPSHPALVDLDGDGDLDLVSGSYPGTFVYFRNSGNASAPAFAVAPNPLAGLDVGSESTPTFGDLDGDGDQDLVAGMLTGAFAYLENTGSATNPLFVQRFGAVNPLDGATVGSLSAPTLGDADGDGDLDLVAGEAFGTFFYFQNTGSARRPAFKALVNASNPLRGENVGGPQFPSPALADLDGDGDLDVVAGNQFGKLFAFENRIGQFVSSGDVDPQEIDPAENASAIMGGDFDGDGDVGIFVTSVKTVGTPPDPCGYFDNTGTATQPSFSAVLLPGLLQAGCVGVPLTVDLDGDADLDLVAGGIWYLNSGTRTAPQFVLGRTLFAQVGPVAPGITFGDLDGDGDFDASVIEHGLNGLSNIPKYYENTGGPTNPLFVERTGSANPLPSTFGLPFLLDPDRDGDSDLLDSSDNGSHPTQGFYWENVGSKASPRFVSRPIASSGSPFGRFVPLASGEAAKFILPYLADIDGDGDDDGFGLVLTIPLKWDVVLLENGIVRPSPRYFGPLATPFGSRSVGGFSNPAAGDLDRDGDPDFVATSSFAGGPIHYFENTGTKVLPAVVERVGVANPFNGIASPWTPLLTLGDLDGDGDLDLLSGDNYGAPLHYYENVGSATAPSFVERVGAANPANGVVAGRSAPALADVDHDGDLDLVVGNGYGTFLYFLNVGTAKTPNFSQRSGLANPFDGLVAGIGFMSNPVLGDVDRDGDLDLIAGDEPTGGFFYFENTGTAPFPAYVSRTGALNPFDGANVGLNSTPALVDLDADGDLDLVAGDRDGTFETYTLPEPSPGGLLAAGIGMLRWLVRRRR